MLGDSSVKRGSNIEKLPSIQVKFPAKTLKVSLLYIWFLNSVGLECNPYKVEVVGSNPTGTTIGD